MTLKRFFDPIVENLGTVLYFASIYWPEDRKPFITKNNIIINNNNNNSNNNNSSNNNLLVWT